MSTSNNSGTSSIHITHWGTQGPTLVMVHGSVQGSSVSGYQHFAAQKKLVEKGWQMIVPDRPGHGMSPAPGRPEDAIADAEWVVDLLGEGAHLLGHSFGGVVAFAAAARRPDAVLSLTLIEPALHALAAENPVVRGFLEYQMKVFTSGLPPQELAVGFMKAVRIPEDLRSGSGDPEELIRVGKALSEVQFPPPPILKEWAETIAKAKIPVLIVTGGWNQAFDISADIVAKLTNGRHVIIKSDHHFTQLANPDEFNDLLNNFMKEAIHA